MIVFEDSPWRKSNHWTFAMKWWLWVVWFILTWNSSLLWLFQLDDEPNHYHGKTVGNHHFHPLKHGCSEFQAIVFLLYALSPHNHGSVEKITSNEWNILFEIHTFSTEPCLWEEGVIFALCIKHPNWLSTFLFWLNILWSTFSGTYCSY